MIGAWIVKRMVRSAYQKMNRGDVDSVMAGWAKDSVYDSASELGVGVTIKGKQAIADWHRRYVEEFPRREFTVKSICLGELLPLVSAFFRTSVIMIDWSIAETNKEGKEFRYDGASILHMKKGKCIHASDCIYMVGLPHLSTLIKPTVKAPK